MKSVNLPDDLESPNDKFFTHPVVEWFLTNAGTVQIVDKKAFGKHQNEDILAKLTEATSVMLSKGAKGYFWVICNPEITDELTTLPCFVSAYNEQFPLGLNIVLHMGILNKRWRIYSDALLAKNAMLIGAGFSKKHNNFYCKMTLEI